MLEIEKIDKFSGDYSFLSNFHDAPVLYNGIRYLNSEAAFQAQKDPTRSLEFANLPPGKAKRLGREVKMMAQWDSIKLVVMREIVHAKFAQNPVLSVKLIHTGDVPIIEGNWWNDTYWGVCNGKGLNMLGKILMDLRKELIEARKEQQR